MSDPMEPLKKLFERLGETTTPLGLRIVGTAFVPGTNGMPDHVQALFEIESEEVGKTVDEKNVDEEILKFRAELNAVDQERQKETTVDRLKKLMEGGGGFLA